MVSLARPVPAVEPWRCALIVLLFSAGFAACDPHRGGRTLTGRASDEWVRSYTPAPGSELQVIGGTGSIDIEVGTGSAIEVRAERIIHAMTDAAARPIVRGIRIREDVMPHRVVLQDQGLADAMVGVDVEVNFYITVPHHTRLRLRMLNGDIHVAGVDAPVVAASTDGSITGASLRSGVDAQATNGDIAVDLAASSGDPIRLRADNGAIRLLLPSQTGADLDANCTNGALDLATLPLQPAGEQTPHHARGRLNGGGMPVSLATFNGTIQVRIRP
jgi:hypothetical protein